MLEAAAGRLAGTSVGAVVGGWYGALAGLALGAMLDAARRHRREAPPYDEPEPSPTDDSSALRDAAAALLEIRADAPASDIKRAFRAISKESHPDGPTPDPERFMAARKAYETLLRNPGAARSGRPAT